MSPRRGGACAAPSVAMTARASTDGTAHGGGLGCSAASVYLLAVLHRDVARRGRPARRAALRHHRRPSSACSSSCQLGVYAAMQIPTGVLVDRYGPRRLLVVGVAGHGRRRNCCSPRCRPIRVALLARACSAAGDAMTFVSVLRFAALHFGPRRYPLLVALTGMIGIDRQRPRHAAAGARPAARRLERRRSPSPPSLSLACRRRGVAAAARRHPGRPRRDPRRRPSSAPGSAACGAGCGPPGRCPAPGSASGCTSRPCRRRPRSASCGAART